jgi:hypothetical protein
MSLVPILSQMNLVHNFPPYFPKIHFNIILSSIPRSSEWSLPFRAFHIKCMNFSSLPCILHFSPISSSLFSLIILVMCTNNEVPHYAVFSSLVPPSILGQNILLSTLFSSTLNLCSSISVRDHWQETLKRRAGSVSQI